MSRVSVLPERDEPDAGQVEFWLALMVRQFDRQEQLNPPQMNMSLIRSVMRT